MPFEKGKSGNPGGRPVNDRRWSDTIRRVALRDKPRLEKIAEKLLKMCEAGDMPALREFGDRFEGKIPQAVEVSEDTTIVVVKRVVVEETPQYEAIEKPSIAEIH